MAARRADARHRGLGLRAEYVYGALALVLAWVAWWTWLGRYHLLDDAFIHLRFAENLIRSGTLSYNDHEPSYGTSSLLYVLLLSGLRTVIASPLLPKAVSILAYIATLGVVVWYWLGSRGRESVLWLLLILALSGPMAVRWLTDGMETSLALLLTAAVVITLHRVAERGGAPVALASAGAAVLATLLRIELILLVTAMGAASVALAVARKTTLYSSVVRILPAAAGAALALLILFACFGSVFPDTAMAKIGAGPFTLGYARAILATLAAAGSFGGGLCLAWMVSIWLVVLASRAGRTSLLPVVIPNLLFPTVIMFAWARGQSLHGFRYFAWSLLASTVWNTLTLRASVEPQAPLPWRRAAGIGALFAAMWAAESPAVARIFSARSATYLTLSRARWDGFASSRAVAGDLGMFGYFSRSQVCDLSGLVNGRVPAMLSQDERARRCAAMRPEVAFLTPIQETVVSPWLDLSTWVHCGSVDFPGVTAVDRHELLVDPSQGRRCPAGFPGGPSRF